MSAIHLHGRVSSAFRRKFRNRRIWLSSVYSISVRCLPSIQVNEVNHSFSCIAYTYMHGSKFRFKILEKKLYTSKIIIQGLA